ncbi:uncharacterized protein LOC131145104 [Malania oleifera]|uniref:uncharacterized protein LOC131145104 n=1 Tax=Malania oleifera TaxID=397392 RepID=UPI0025AE6B18|nr:uncharacterized protein LOC131145104 [Malania oleifera]XP_057950175.1 uncharacterized protein LOC131145104 [Malania oleifera]
MDDELNILPISSHKRSIIPVLVKEEHLDYDVVKSANPEFKKATIRINIYKQHRQTIQENKCSLLRINKHVVPATHKQHPNRSPLRLSLSVLSSACLPRPSTPSVRRCCGLLPAACFLLPAANDPVLSSSPPAVIHSHRPTAALPSSARSRRTQLPQVGMGGIRNVIAWGIMRKKVDERIRTQTSLSTRQCRLLICISCSVKSRSIVLWWYKN